MSTYDHHLAGGLDRLAADVFGEFILTPSMVAELAAASAARLRQFAGMPAHLLPPPPIVPIVLEPMPAGAFESVLEERDGHDSGFHDVGALPARNARLKPPKGSEIEEARPRQIFEDPRLKPGYRPPPKR